MTLFYGKVEPRVLSQDEKVTSYEFIMHYECDHEGTTEMRRGYVDGEPEQEYLLTYCRMCQHIVGAEKVEYVNCENNRREP